MAKGRSIADAFAGDEPVRRIRASSEKPRTVKSFHIDKDLVVPLKVYCAQSGRNQSDVVSTCLRELLEREGYLG